MNETQIITKREYDKLTDREKVEHHVSIREALIEAGVMRVASEKGDPQLNS